MIRETLEPSLDLLSEQHVLVQAWKKTTSYIRDHSWYADTLELDMSAARLPEFIEKLQHELRNGQNWVNDPVRIVPAPKSHSWKISNDGSWQPVNGNKDAAKNLRPLAHVSLRDQVIATAAMMCLADRVETEQGDTCLDYVDPEKRKTIISYGNRLFCDRDNGKLRHRWGSTKSYRKYFQDYRTFVRRPEAVAIAHQKANRGRVAIIQTDISKFYDRIRPSILHQKLLRFCDGKKGGPFMPF